MRPKYVVTYFFDPDLNEITSLRIGQTPSNLFRHLADLARNFQDFMILFYKSHCPALFVNYITHFYDYDIEFRVVKQFRKPY